MNSSCSAVSRRLPNKPLHATVPPQGHRSIIERPARAAAPRVNGQTLARPVGGIAGRDESKEGTADSVSTSVLLGR